MRARDAGVGLIAAAVLSVAAGGWVRWQVRAERQDPASGAYLYRTLCASCHGEAARGDGPVAGLLRRRPSDLTTIASRAQGAFPRARVAASIDGREVVAAHGPREMPVWGDALGAIEGPSEAIIRKRIDALVSHIESLQTSR